MNQQRHEFTITGAKVTLTERRYSGRTREYTAAPRLYVSVENDAETVIGNLMNRTRRPYNVYKTLIHGTTLGKHLDLSKLSWSQHIGRRCAYSKCGKACARVCQRLIRTTGLGRKPQAGKN